MHDSVLAEPVPDRFLELLRQMEGQKDGQKDRLNDAAPAERS